MENIKSEINVLLFAKNLAQSDDINQANMLNKFAQELKICCNDRDLSGVQPCNIAEKLDKNGIDLIKSLNEFIILREQTLVK